MPVPLSVMQAAVQGDKKAIRLVEQEYGVGDGRRYAENWLSEEEPPPTVPMGVKGIQGSLLPMEQTGRDPTRYDSKDSGDFMDASRFGRNVSITGYKTEIPFEHPPGQWQYYEKASQQVKEGEAKILAEKLSRLKKKSDIQDVLLKVAGEDYALAQRTALQLQIGGGAALGVAGGVGQFARIGMPAAEAAIGGSALSVPGAFFGLMAGGPSDFKSNAANKKFADIELSPEAQTIYDEYKTLGYSPTYYKTK